jgi:branched-subunit amino acid ABC-type transport system permease component
MLRFTWSTTGRYPSATYTPFEVGFAWSVYRQTRAPCSRKIRETAATAAPALSSMLIYFLMALVLIVRPTGLFPGNAK